MAREEKLLWCILMKLQKFKSNEIDMRQRGG